MVDASTVVNQLAIRCFKVERIFFRTSEKAFNSIFKVSEIFAFGLADGGSLGDEFGEAFG